MDVITIPILQIKKTIPRDIKLLEVTKPVTGLDWESKPSGMASVCC